MAKKILFSPIGGTDPIKYFRDGSMLHICRVYQPDKVYLYLSKEMLANHLADNRYVHTLELLGEKLKHTFEIEIIERENLTDVQRYDLYYKEFREIILNIQKDMSEEDELIINMASGTPAMKSALFVLATLAEYRFKPIQVSTPKRRINSEHEERDDYDVETNWELNEDNSDDFENRCEEVKSLNLVKLLKIDVLKKHLKAYDYHAALEIGYELENDIAAEALDLLKIADARVKLNGSFISKIAAGKNYNIYPVKEAGKQKVFEYALYLNMKYQKEEYADFIRGVTPLVVDILKTILKNKCKINIDNYCKNTDGGMRWNKGKLQKDGLLEALDTYYIDRGGFNGGVVYSDHLNALVCIKSEDEVLKNKVAEIVKIEHDVRNLAAHEIVSVTDDWFKEHCNHSAKEIMSLIRYLIGSAGIHAGDKEWASYDAMNEQIENYL